MNERVQSFRFIHSFKSNLSLVFPPSSVFISGASARSQRARACQCLCTPFKSKGPPLKCCVRGGREGVDSTAFRSIPLHSILLRCVRFCIRLGFHVSDTRFKPTGEGAQAFRAAAKAAYQAQGSRQGVLDWTNLT